VELEEGIRKMYKWYIEDTFGSIYFRETEKTFADMS